MMREKNKHFRATQQIHVFGQKNMFALEYRQMVERKPKRTFKVSDSSSGFKGGRYKGTNPLDVAKKAARQIFKKSGGSSATFTLCETTSGSNHKEFKYSATRKKLSSPIEREVPDPHNSSKKITIMVTHEVSVQSAK